MKSHFSVSILCFALLFLSACQVVDDGYVGVSKSFGNIANESLTPGPYFNLPVIREVELYNVKTQRRSLILDIPSAEGLIVKLQTTVLFRPLDVVTLRKSVGAAYVQIILDSTLTDTFREEIGKKKVEEIITNQEKLTTSVFERLKEQMSKRGVVIEDLMVTGLELPLKFKEAIEKKLAQEQKAFQKEFELKQAMKDAEIEVARARGAAEAQKIVRSTLSSEYLQYLWISTLNDNPNVIYVATEANMPLFRTTEEQSVSGKKPVMSKK